LNCISLPIIAQNSTDTTRQVAATPADSGSVKKYKFLLYPSFGAGLFRNDLAPTFIINIGLRKRNIYEVNVNTNSIFFFERDDNRNFQMYRNTFLNAEFLLNFSFFNSGSTNNWNGLGFGYLVESKGQYFKEATFMVYYRKKLRHLSIMPGIIFSDNLKDAFPVITIRL
jgi:hypothetical protein